MKVNWLIILALVLVVTLNSNANAQSKDYDNPTKMTSNVVSETLTPDKQGSKYYYSFVADPGEFTVTLTLESAQGNNIVSATLALFDDRDVRIGAERDVMAYSGSTQQVVEKFTVDHRQRLTVRVYVTPYNTGNGKYRLRVAGPIKFEESSDPNEQLREATADYPECIPKRGTLVLRMKDGSKKTINLSDVEKLFILH
jgi:hypothetical protein